MIHKDRFIHIEIGAAHDRRVRHRRHDHAPLGFLRPHQPVVGEGRPFRGRVIIITFRDDRETTAADLRGWGVNFHKLICWTMDTCDLADIDGWKAKVCRRHGVDLFFEDDPDVLAKVDPATVCFTPFGAVSKAKKWKLREQTM